MQSVKSPRIDFLDITYLKFGNKKQQKVYQALVENRIMEKLSAYTPILVGTIPLNIDIETSDIDIIVMPEIKTSSLTPLLMISKI